MRVQEYVFTLPQRVDKRPGRRLDVEARPAVTIRVVRMMTNVTSSGLVSIDSLTINGREQLMGAVDAYRFTFEYHREIRDEVLKGLGLFGKSDDEIDAYLDEHEIELPDPLKIDLSTVTKGTPVRVRGQFSETLPNDFTFTLAMFGPAIVDDQDTVRPVLGPSVPLHRKQ